MLNEERIKVMTRLAVFEKEHGKENAVASKFYKSDYIGYNMLWTAIMTTIAYALGLALFFALNFEEYMAKLHKMNLIEQAKIVIVLYVMILTVMLMISYFLYRKRYHKAQKGLKKYCGMLHDLEKLYNSERHREKTKQEDR